MYGTMPEPCTAQLAWKLDTCSQASDHFHMILYDTQDAESEREIKTSLWYIEKFWVKCVQLQTYYVSEM